MSIFNFYIIYFAKGVRRMRDYTYTYLKDLAMPMETVRLIGRINEYKGKQDLYKQQAPQILNILRDVAVIQSTKASNAIEGIIYRIQNYLKGFLHDF